jgi:hypothetical protein
MQLLEGFKGKQKAGNCPWGGGNFKESPTDEDRRG